MPANKSALPFINYEFAVLFFFCPRGCLLSFFFLFFTLTLCMNLCQLVQPQS